MKQYEFSIRIAQIHHLLEEHKYKKALAVVRTIDLKQVKNLSDLSVIADVFAKTEQFESAKDAYLKIYNKSKTRRILQRLIYVSIRTKDIDEAEDYYQEFVQMNPSSRDIITTRYRIDKAAGVPIGKLIETLEELKEEERIEEWVYELAKLYHKAGRFEECRRECEDIKLWFGNGEIVERAKKLIEVIDDKETMSYFDDKDYTLDKGEPNPDDTGSLPDLNEYLQRKPSMEEKKIENHIAGSAPEMEWIESRELGNKQSKTLNNDRNDENMHEQGDFIDDYDEDDFDMDAGFGKLARKLTGLFRFGSKKNNNNNNSNRNNNNSDADKSSAVQRNYAKKDYNSEEKIKSEHNIEDNSQNDLDIKISINNELYNRTLENKKDRDIDREDNLSRNVREEPVENEFCNEAATSETSTSTIQQSPVVPVYSQSGMGITQDLSREISAIYEAEHGEQIKEKKERDVKTVNDRRPLKRDATKVIERMTKAVRSDESKSIQSVDTSYPEEQIQERVLEKISLDQELVDEEIETEIEETKIEQTEEIETEIEEIETEIEETERIETEVEIAVKTETTAETNAIEEEARIKEEEARAIVEEARRKAEEAERILAEAERKRAEVAALLSSCHEKVEDKELQEPKELERGIDIEDMAEDTPYEEEDENWSENKNKDSEWYEDENYNDEFYDDAEYEDDEDILDFDSKGLSDDDLPTTRALHKSFDDILTLIGGEPDPSHFVFVGNTSDLIVGLAKRVVKVMKETGYMSTGRIAKISAKKLNQMDLNEFKSQLKGNCLLIHEAAELMVPTIASVFDIMDEFYGDFVVILADDGNTLDQLFKFAPALARRFKYIIDISGYTKADCL